MVLLGILISRFRRSGSPPLELPYFLYRLFEVHLDRGLQLAPFRGKLSVFQLSHGDGVLKS